MLFVSVHQTTATSFAWTRTHLGIVDLDLSGFILWPSHYPFSILYFILWTPDIQMTTLGNQQTYRQIIRMAGYSVGYSEYTVKQERGARVSISHPPTAAPARMSHRQGGSGNPCSKPSVPLCSRSVVKIVTLHQWLDDPRERGGERLQLYSNYRKKALFGAFRLLNSEVNEPDFTNLCAWHYPFQCVHCLQPGQLAEKQRQEQTQTEKGYLLATNREAPSSGHSSSQYKQMNTARSKADGLSKLLLLRKWLLAEKVLTQVRQIPPECIKESKCIK